ncbi:MAG: aminopeptidase [Oligoflexia bacterium]|nr:aminopeptidase [Oligoflexia bacterium]
MKQGFRGYYHRVSLLFLLLILFLLFFLFLFSCASFRYIVDQGSGQLKIQNSAVTNEKALQDPRISKEDKRKIQEIIQYKKYFYDYFQKRASGIYSKTTILEHSEVSHMVVASRFNEIKAKEHCFWFVGCFPYLGFFNHKAAEEYVQSLEQEGYVTLKRPIYAYSTLGYFEDTILSSFFNFSNESLAELVFHELFHTIFFIKGEVGFSENLANYMGEEMAFEYFHYTEEKKKEIKSFRSNRQKLNNLAVALIKELSLRYQKEKPADKVSGQQMLNQFLQERFFPTLAKECKILKLERNGKCSFLERTWNNASMTLFLTYEESVDDFGKIREKLHLPIKEFLSYIETQYGMYKKLPSDKREQGFAGFFFSAIHDR